MNTRISTRTTRHLAVLQTGTLWAGPVVVNWQSSDLAQFPTAYASVLAATMGVKLETKSTSTAEPSSGMTTSTTAGIAVGAVLAVAFMFGLAIYCCLRKRKKTEHPTVPEMSGHSSGFKSMLRGNWRGEMDGGSQPVEIDSRKVLVIPGPPVELEAEQLRRGSSDAAAAAATATQNNGVSCLGRNGL